MKKSSLVLLFGMLVLALSGCVIVGGGPSVSNFQFQSNWQLTSTQQYVFCTNRPSQIGYSFRASGGTITSITETYVGTASGRTFTFNRDPGTLAVSGNTYTALANIVFGQNAVPQGMTSGVSQQAIVITPITPPTSQNGATTVTVTLVVDGFTFTSPSYTFNTYANCP